jgi:hypothetical protein
MISLPVTPTNRRLLVKVKVKVNPVAQAKKVRSRLVMSSPKKEGDEVWVVIKGNVYKYVSSPQTSIRKGADGQHDRMVRRSSRWIGDHYVQ